MNIIVQMPNWIGDIVMAIPLLRNLREYYPSAKIIAMCRDPQSDLLKEMPYIDEIFSYRKPKGVLDLKGHDQIIQKLRKFEFHIGILLTNSLSSAFWFFHGGVKRRIGFNIGIRNFYLTDDLEKPKDKRSIHQMHEYLMLLQPLSISAANKLPKLFTSKEEKQEAKSFCQKLGLDEQKTLIGINPGAAYGSAKCWLLEYYQELITTLLAERKDVAILLFGSADQRQSLEELVLLNPDRVKNSAGLTSIRMMVALMTQVRILVTGDSGPMHVADALKTPVIALFGSTDPNRSAPACGGEILYKKVSCSPCFRRECPIDFPCMTSITPKEVLSRVLTKITKDTPFLEETSLGSVGN